MSEIELKPCPFCGKPGERWVDPWGRPWEYQGCNGDCDISMSVDRWNTRPVEDALLARAEAAEAELQQMREASDMMTIVNNLDKMRSLLETGETPLGRAMKAEAEVKRLREALDEDRRLLRIGTYMAGAMLLGWNDEGPPDVPSREKWDAWWTEASDFIDPDEAA